MFETWFKKVQSGVTKHHLKSFRWLLVFPPHLCIIITVVALVGGRLLWVKASRPAHISEIAAAFGSASQFYGVPQMNHSGSQFTYVATADHGFALFLYDMATGKKRDMAGQNDLGTWGDSLYIHAGPWAPDDRSFIFSIQTNLFLCPVDANLASVKLDVGNNATLDNIIWVNPSEFVWLDGQTICYAQKAADGQWEVHKLPHHGHISSLAAVDEQTIAWLEENYICRLNLTEYLAGTNNPFATLSADAVPLTNDLMLWLDASTLQQSNQTPVTGLADLSLNNNSVIINQNAPIFNATNSPGALNQKGTIHFKSGHALTDATGLKTIRHLGIAGFQPRSIFAVMRRDIGRSKMLISLGNALTNGNYFGVCDQRDGLYLPSGYFPDKNSGRKAALPPTWHILEMIYDGTNGNSYVNGSILGAVALPFNTADAEVELGLRIADDKARINTAASDGDFAELLIYDHALDFAEQREVEDYLGTKWFGNLRSVSPKSSFVWLDPQLTGLTGFKYSKEMGRFLISRTENDRDSLWRLDTGAGALTKASLVMQDRSLQDAQWVGTGEFDCVSRELGHQGLLLADSTGKQTARLFGHEDIPWYQVAPDGKRMLILGSFSNSPSWGIWQYDFGSRQMSPVVSWSDHPSSYAGNLIPFHGTIRLPSGRSVPCTIFPPANFDRHKKYPLVIGYTFFQMVVSGMHGRLWVPSIATSGAFVAWVDRNNFGYEYPEWDEYVMSLYTSLVQDPCIDKQQVFLFASSAETTYMSKCLTNHPGLWKGAICLNPSDLPDFSGSPQFQSRPKILLSAGGEEHREDRFKKYQADALAQGVMVEFIIHPGEKHHLVGNAAQLERAQAMVHFIFEE